jgi:hypothetical protein
VIEKIRRAIVEAVFERELDEDYELGTRYGAEMARKSFKLQLQLLHDQALKRDQPGIAKALAQLGDN